MLIIDEQMSEDEEKDEEDEEKEEEEKEEDYEDEDEGESSGLPPTDENLAIINTNYKVILIRLKWISSGNIGSK